MKVSDYVVEFLIKKGTTDVFGYPGGMVTHLMDSFDKYHNEISTHVCYHEQAAAFEACGYAQASGKTGVAYATSGPGATNLITGICNAYFDSIPVLFITGQVNTFESKRNYNIRQRGFQETDIVGMVRGVTKYCVCVEAADKIGEELEKAWEIAAEGRKGPVLLDIPMDIFRGEINEIFPEFLPRKPVVLDNMYSVILKKLEVARKPCIIAGSGINTELSRNQFVSVVNRMNIPVVTSMVAVDLLPDTNGLNYGFLGAYGDRTANFIVAKSDVILVLGARLDVRQVGGKREKFAPNAQIIRADIDENELSYQIRPDEIDICADVEDVLQYLKTNWNKPRSIFFDWISVCNTIRTSLHEIDEQKSSRIVKRLSQYIPENSIITTDVGQNQVWIAQSFKKKRGQKILFSGGHGAMGYSLPAAIGAYYGSKRPVISFNGDGGFQMNMQELQFITREDIPIKIIVFNNHALGMIRHFQEMYFDCNYAQTVEGKGYEAPDLKRLAEAYHMEYYCFSTEKEINGKFMEKDYPALIEINIQEDTYVFPKLEFGKPGQDQEPLLDRRLYQELMEL